MDNAYSMSAGSINKSPPAQRMQVAIERIDRINADLNDLMNSIAPSPQGVDGDGPMVSRTMPLAEILSVGPNMIDAAVDSALSKIDTLRDILLR